jgi:hypothetical protein
MARMRRLPRLQRLSGLSELPMWRRLPMRGLCRWCCGMRRIMRGLLLIVGPLPLVLGLGAFRMSNSRVDRSLAGLKKGSGQLLDFATTLASAACR